MTDEDRVRVVLVELDGIARDADHHEYGLPMYSDGPRAAMVAVVMGAILAERERCAKLVEGYDPDRVYHSDADGNEFPAGIDWDLTQSCLAKYIREGT